VVHLMLVSVAFLGELLAALFALVWIQIVQHA